jgi:hypothetical protein
MRNVDFVEIGFTDQMDLILSSIPQQKVVYRVAHDFVFKTMESRSFVYEKCAVNIFAPIYFFSGVHHGFCVRGTIGYSFA